MLFAGTAHAGGTSSSGTDSGSESGSDSGSDTSGADTGTSTTLDTGGFDEGSCGNCSPGSDGEITFAAPADGDVVLSPFTVDVSATADCGCDDCGCYDDDPEQIAITVDGNPYGESCGGSSCTFELDLPVGTHEITAIASFDFHENTRSIQVTVAPTDDAETGNASATESATATDTADESSSAGADDDEDESSGCSCRADAPGTGGTSAAFVLFGLFAARRRSRR
jgi:MYXO-CTERM domain-containing protein